MQTGITPQEGIEIAGNEFQKRPLVAAVLVCLATIIWLALLLLDAAKRIETLHKEKLEVITNCLREQIKTQEAIQRLENAVSDDEPQEPPLKKTKQNGRGKGN